MKKINILYLILTICLIILLFNLFYLIQHNEIKLLENFKCNDYFFINNNIKSFYKISKIFSKKFVSKMHFSILHNILLLFKDLIFQFKKKTIFIYFEDNHDYLIYILQKLLNTKYIIKITPENPDYLIYNVFNCNHLNKTFTNSIKIAFFTENQIPDFNIADYAISHAHINYLDRYFSYPYYFFDNLKIFNKDYKAIRNKVIQNPIRKKFCAALITNHWHTDRFRINFINIIKINIIILLFIFIKIECLLMN